MATYDLFFNGQILLWETWGKRKYKSSSGLLETVDGQESGKRDGILDYRYAKFSKKKNHGPIPEGIYTFIVKDSKGFPSALWKNCDLASAGRRTGIQTIPRGLEARNRIGSEDIDCERYWVNWGNNRIKIFPSKKTNTYGRGGFYLHDSAKGYTHGCIEVDKKFFDDLRLYIHLPKRKEKLVLQVDYKNGNTHTYGL